LKVKNTGIRAVELEWKIFDKVDLEKSENDIFNVAVDFNNGFDRAENPYRFAFELIEPEVSYESIYSIEPKYTVMGPREVQTFTVTFSPDKPGKLAGQYSSIVMATPSLT
jgi:hypothetical protein